MGKFENKVEAGISLWSNSPDEEEVALGIIMDENSAQLNILTDGTYFAHLHINEKLKLEICFSDLIGKTERGVAAEIDLKALLKLAATMLENKVDISKLELGFKVKASFSCQ